MDKIIPCLWFDGKAEDAAEFYVSVFPDARIDAKNRCAIDWPGGKAGDVVLVEFTLAGQSYQALNGGPGQEFNEAISLSVVCKDQAEVDKVWDALTADGGEPIMCGWLKDRFGVRWQVVPEAMTEMLRDDDPEKSKRVMSAMMEMVKLNEAKLKAAYEG